ncbi:MAG: carboxymuconolactone decarboxylase family protein [Planctomycetota bacterium]|nr:carboxymuconolactone decarboxylase family protein [Planctomycetota bacterium]MDP6519216.1 carboxymuconolactone decarboxylase family protein [Planctomycetota bacterium]MDP6838417.1 carboxymuconolactone decarboxylase family protein [Planctomycetota bacterium]
MTLTEDETRLVRFFTACVIGDWPVARRELTSGAVDSSWREALLQLHLFAGFPRLIQAFRIVDETLEETRPLPRDDTPEAPPEEQAENGAALFDSIYDDLAESVRGELMAYDPNLASWIADHAYGRVLARPGLTPRLRELLAVGALIALGQDRQLASHARGALRCGAAVEEPGQVLEALTDILASEQLAQARGVIERFTA